MRLATVRIGGAPRVVADDGQRQLLLKVPSIRALLEQGALDDAAQYADRELAAGETLDFLPVVPDAGKIICVGHNYRAHILELGHDLPAYPNVFNKYPDALLGANDPISLAPVASNWDWEAELALVIGAPVPQGSTPGASAIAGYTVANDISARDWQKRATQWLLGKTFANTTPLGPWLVPAADFDPSEPHEISCHVDGVERQKSVTNDLLFTPSDLVDYLAQVLPLAPGDVVLTGTPGGVGMAMTPPVFLSPGQEVVTRIDGLGELRNLCINPSDQGGK